MGCNHLPAINVSNDFTCVLLSMLKLQIFIDPCDEVVLEHAFNELMKKIQGNEFVDVCVGEIQSERLQDSSKLEWTQK